MGRWLRPGVVQSPQLLAADNEPASMVPPRLTLCNVQGRELVVVYKTAQSLVASDNIHGTSGACFTLFAAQAGVADLVHAITGLVALPLRLFALIDKTDSRWVPRVSFTLTSAAVNRVAENIFWMQSYISKVKLDAGTRITKF